MRNTLPTAGAIKYIARDLRADYNEIIQILIDLGYLYDDGKTVTPEGRLEGVKEYDNGGLGASFKLLDQILSVYNPKSFKWRCDNCETLLDVQPGFTNRYKYWTCTKCGYKNIVVNTGDNIRYEK